MKLGTIFFQWWTFLRVMFYFCVFFNNWIWFCSFEAFWRKKNFFLGHFFYPDLPVPPNIFVQSFTCCVLVSFFHYFRFQMILVSENITVPFGYSLIFTNPNFISHLKKELKNENHWKNIQFLVWFYRVILTQCETSRFRFYVKSYLRQDLPF